MGAWLPLTTRDSGAVAAYLGVERDGFGGEDIDARFEAPRRDKFSEGVEIYDVRTADEDEDGVRLDEFQLLAREQRLILRGWRGKHEDHAGGGEQIV